MFCQNVRQAQIVIFAMDCAGLLRPATDEKKPARGGL